MIYFWIGLLIITLLLIYYFHTRQGVNSKEPVENKEYILDEKSINLLLNS